MFVYDILETKDLYKNKYTGCLFVYSIGLGDFFTQISRNIDTEKDFKYIVAIRPYVISPQYLYMINESINKISPNKVKINFISGWINDEEAAFGGIYGEINDKSSNIDRSNYLIKYLDAIKNSEIKNLDYYVSTTNEFVFDACNKKNIKMIIPYSQYKKNIYDLKNKKITISLSIKLRETEEEIISLTKDKNLTDSENFTYEKFNLFIEELKKDGINDLILHCWEEEERKIVNNFVKQYKEREKQ